MVQTFIYLAKIPTEYIFLCLQGVKVTVARSSFATNECTRATNFQNFNGFKHCYWCLSCSNMHSYGRSRLLSLVCSVCTLSDQLQATAPLGADTAYLWACFSENCSAQSPGNPQCCALLLFKSSRQCTSDLINILPRSCCIFMAYMLLSTNSRYCKVYTQCSGD